MATVQNIYIDQGTTFSMTINLTNLDGTAKDLTDYTVAAQMRKSYYTNSYTAFTTEVDGDAEDGTVSMSLTAAQTSALKAGRYVYDLEATSSEETIRVIEGIVTVTPEATK